MVTKNHRAAAALSAVFPTVGSFKKFKSDPENKKTIDSLVAFAYSQKLIPAENADELLDYIQNNATKMEATPRNKHLRFEGFLAQKETLLDLNLSVRALTERINSLVAKHKVALPKLSNSMFSRLKKEAADTLHKQNVLRSLAFWLGHDRPHLASRWHFENLIALCREGKQSTEHKEGVRIGFALHSRGDVIDHDIVGWLKRELKNYIETSIDCFSYGRWGKVRSHDITTLYVDFPKEQAADNPAAYRQCLGSALSLAHQMAVRWPLSEHGSRNRFLSIGIAAGEFTTLDNYLIPIFNTKLPGDPVIRLTDYASQCATVNDIRALLCDQPVEVTLLNGETLLVWWVKGFWTTLYFDFIPQLLEDPVLGSDERSYRLLLGKLWPSIVRDNFEENLDGKDAISTLFRSPHNAMLGLEIAKTLYYRRRFREALEVLKFVLSLNPHHLNARVLRMTLWRNLALDAPTYNFARGLFRQSYMEAEYIQKWCNCDSEEFYCEYAIVYLAEALMALRHMRAGRGVIAGAGKGDSMIRQILYWMERAEALLGMGLVVSPTGIRALYLLNAVKVLIAVLANDLQLFCDADRPIDGPEDLIAQTNMEYQWEMGLLRPDIQEEASYGISEKIYLSLYESHDDSISLEAYRPTTYYCSAVSWWDMFPIRTVAAAKHALQCLKDAGRIAHTAARQNVCIYAFTRIYGEMMPVADFASHIQRCIELIESQSGGNLDQRDDREIIANQKGSPRKGLMMTLNF